MKYKNIFVTKKQRPELEKPISEEIFLTELRDCLNEIHNELGRFNLSYVALAFSHIAFAFA